MKFSVVVTARAEDDLLSILDYIAIDSPAQADRVAERLSSAILELGDAALRYALIPGYEARNTRRRVVGSYAIYYRIRGEVVEIAHVLHSARDFNRLVFPDEP